MHVYIHQQADNRRDTKAMEDKHRELYSAIMLKKQGVSDRYKVAYYRRRKGKEIAEEDDVASTVADSNEEGGSGASV